jgi:hypothetical protein
LVAWKTGNLGWYEPVVDDMALGVSKSKRWIDNKEQLWNGYRIILLFRNVYKATVWR